MAEWINQKKVWAGRRGNVTFWAWTASVMVHLALLMVFGLAKFSKSQAEDKHHVAPIARVSRIKKLAEAASIIPKPKVKKPLRDLFSQRTVKMSPTNRDFSTVNPDVQKLQNFLKPAVPARDVSVANVAILPNGIEFFGSRTYQRKVCYVVDCSGSMRGLLVRVQEKLKDSIKALQPDQYFYIIFFGNDRLSEFGNGRLVRASQKAKSDAYDFIALAKAAGQTNALSALERALQIRDGSGVSPSVIYFLTDGFELTTEDVRRFSRKIIGLLGQFAPRTRINTIGFWPDNNDRKMLEIIARQSGGECIFITDGDS